MSTPTPHTKQLLYAACQDYVKQRQATAQEAIAAAKEAAAGETKSSAGDKYETGRAMAQLAEEQAQGQLAEANRLAESLGRLEAAQATETVQAGSLVVTPSARYYLAVSVGKVSVEGLDYFVVSPAAPIAKALMGAKAGEQVMFQKRALSISQVL